VTNRGERVDLALVADVGPAVDHGGRADAAVVAEADAGSDLHVRSDHRAFANARPRVHDSGRIDLGAIGNEPEQELRLGDELIADVRDGPGSRQRRPALAD
jgi:hypothetical protein